MQQKNKHKQEPETIWHGNWEQKTDSNTNNLRGGGGKNKEKKCRQAWSSEASVQRTKMSCVPTECVHRQSSSNKMMGENETYNNHDAVWEPGATDRLMKRKRQNAQFAINVCQVAVGSSMSG